MGIVTFKEYEDGSVVNDRLGINNLIVAYSGTPYEIYNRFGLYTDHIILDISPLLAIAPHAMVARGDLTSRALYRLFNVPKFAGGGGLTNACYANLFEQMVVALSGPREAVMVNMPDIIKSICLNSLSRISLDGVDEIDIGYEYPEIHGGDIKLVYDYMTKFNGLLIDIFSNYRLESKTNILCIEDNTHDSVRLIAEPRNMIRVFHIRDIECILNSNKGVGYARAIIRCWSEYSGVCPAGS